MGRNGWRPAAALVAVAIGITALSACSDESVVRPLTTDPATSVEQVTAAAEYCVDQGGEVQHRQPAWRTDLDEADWEPLGDPVAVCRFQALDDDTPSRIYVDLVTLYSEDPTLAALAYLSRPEIPDDPPGDPASALCSSIGGTSAFGTTGAGGGLTDPDDPDEPVVSPCTFADGSFIDEWGLAYFGGGTVRGKDLSGAFRFDRSTLPQVF